MDDTRGAAEILFNEGCYEDAVCLLEILVNQQLREYGPNSARTLQTRSRISEILLVQDKYADALKMLLDIYSKKLRVLGLKHPCTLDTRSSIVDLLQKYGTVDVTSQVMDDAEKIFRYLMKMTKKRYLRGRYREALKDGLDILEDMLEFLGDGSPITLDMATLVAIIYSTTEEYDYALEIIEDVYQKKRHLLGPHDRRVASTLMRKASVLLKMCDFEEAMKCYCLAHDIRKFVLGSYHRKTLISMRGIAEVTYTVGNYDEALSVLDEIIRIQKHYNYREVILTRIHTGILEYNRGNYEDALYIFREILIDSKTPKRIKAMIQNKKGSCLLKLGRYYEASLVFKDACRIIKKTDFRAETLSTYRNLALWLAKEGKVITADAMFNILVATCAVTLSAGHSVGFSIEDDHGDFYFARGQFPEALRIFTKLWNFQSLTLGKYHPASLHAKCQVAKVFKEQGRYDEALRMYNEVLPALKAHFYPQHREYLDVERQIASIYLIRGSYVTAFDIYYKNYDTITRNYEADHPYIIEIIDEMQTFTDHVPLRRLIEATLMESLEDVRTYVEDGDDVNARDVNGAVTLHYASREGCVDILKYLLSKGAIYDIEDMFGNTPESFCADDATKFVFLLVKRMFECIERNEVEQVKKIIRKENLIINTRDAVCRTPLQRAVAKGHFEIVQELVSQGADISLGSEEDGTALHMATDRGLSEILEFLLNHLRRNNLDMFRNLIDSKSNVMGATPLHIAAKKNRVACVNVLMKYVANPMVREIFDNFPYDFGNHGMKERLLAYAFNFLNRYN